MAWFGAGACIMFFLISQFAFTNEKKNGKANANGQAAVQWTVPDIPRDIDFAGEKTPMDRWDIKERFERE